MESTTRTEFYEDLPTERHSEIVEEPEQTFHEEAPVTQETTVPHEVEEQAKYHSTAAACLLDDEKKHIITTKVISYTTLDELVLKIEMVEEEINETAKIMDTKISRNEQLRIKMEIENLQLAQMEKDHDRSVGIITELSTWIDNLTTKKNSLIVKQETFLGLINEKNKEFAKRMDTFRNKYANLSKELELNERFEENGCDGVRVAIETERLLLGQKLEEIQNKQLELTQKKTGLVNSTTLIKDKIREVNNEKNDILNKMNGKVLKQQEIQTFKEDKLKVFNQFKTELNNVELNVNDIVTKRTLTEESAKKEAKLVEEHNQIVSKYSKEYEEIVDALNNLKVEFEKKQDELTSSTESYNVRFKEADAEITRINEELVKVRNERKSCVDAFEMSNTDYMLKLEKLTKITENKLELKGTVLKNELFLEEKRHEQLMLTKKLENTKNDLDIQLNAADKKLVQVQGDIKQIPVLTRENLDKITKNHTESVTDFDKKITYATSSSTYLTEKIQSKKIDLENAATIANDKKHQIAETTEKNNTTKKKITTILTKKRDKLMEDYAELLRNETSSHEIDSQSQRAISGILKSPGGKKRPRTPSPKRVQFIGLSSISSSSTIEETETNDQMIKTANELFEQLVHSSVSNEVVGKQRKYI